jgi:lipopolysaccharide transport system ATP-binding protein
MSSDCAIRCAGVAKSFQIFSNYNDRLWQVLFGRYKKFYEDYWVLNDVTFDVGKGECIGIIGRNGAGKTTLLQLICGISQPTRGEISTKGKIAPVLALGAGFDGDLTGRENALVGGAILGLPRRDVESRLDAIAEFAAIGDFFDRQVKFYSSGMISRLAFSICAHVDSEILVIDEVLAVGDEAFRDKCLRFLQDFRRTGTILFVSHNLAHVASLCDRVLWIDGGQIRAIGSGASVIDKYKRALAREKDDASRFHLGPEAHRPPNSAVDASEANGPNAVARVARLAQSARAELEGNILPFWLGLEDRTYGGHFARMENDGRLTKTADKTSVFAGRILWTLSDAHRILGNAECLAQATRTKRFVVDHLLDRGRGGVYWTATHKGDCLSDRKRLFCQSFAIFGLSNYFRTSGDAEARDVSMGLFETVEKRMRTGLAGAYHEEFEGDWSPIPAPYTTNAHLHLLEAYSELLVATGDASVRRSLGDLMSLMLDRFVSPSDHTFQRLDEKLQPLHDPISFGHDIEASWLFDEAADRLGDADMSARARIAASRLARAVFRGAQQPDGSWIDAGDDSGTAREWRLWWVQAEAMNGTVNEALRSAQADASLIDAAEATWRFIESRQVDRRGGDWFNEVSPDGAPNPLQPKVSLWKDPYHQARTCLRLIECSS